MCGRYSVGVSTRDLEEIFDAEAAEPLALPRWNVAPTQRAPVVLADERGRRRLGELAWGLDGRLINARAETVASRAAFRDAFLKRRCLVPADGFYEWSRVEGRKQPWWIHPLRGRVLAFAGLWERGHFTILTTEPDAAVRPLHDRMPLALPRAAWTAWLDPATPAGALTDLLSRPVEGELAVRPVSPRVNRPDHDDPGCVEPVSEPAPEQSDLFEGR